MWIRSRESLAPLASAAALLALLLIGCSSGGDGSPDVIGTPGGGVPGDRPNILLVEPETTCASGGTIVTISGRFLTTSPSPQVWINGVAATVIATGIDGTTGLDTLTVRTGVDPAVIPVSGRAVTVTVTTARGSDELVAGVLLLPGCDGPPIPISINPVSADRVGGAQLTVRGQGLACVLSVQLVGQVSGTTLTTPVLRVVSDSEIVVGSPANASMVDEAYDVRVANSCGQAVLAGAFRFGAEGGNPDCPLLPEISDVQPRVGPAGVPVRLTGLNLVGADAGQPTVSFGVAAATIVDAQPTTLLVTSPAGLPLNEPVSISVTTCAGTTVAAFQFTFTEVEDCEIPPSEVIISSPVPARGAIGAAVTIEGKALVGEDGLPGEVRFGAFVAPLLSSARDLPVPGTDTLVVTAPNAGVPAGDSAVVTVRTCGGTAASAQSFEYVDVPPCGPPPIVVTVTPDEGQGGDLVVLEGTNLVGADGLVPVVSFGTFPTDVVSASRTRLLVAAPLGLPDGATVSITVVTCGGQGVTDEGYTYVDPSAACTDPVLASFSPTSGRAGDLVTLTGTDLVGADLNDTRVFFGTFEASIVSQTATEVLARVPSGPPLGASVSVALETCGGTEIASDPSRFTYSGAEDFNVLSIVPPAGPRTGGQAIVITGTGLQDVDSIEICDVVATAVTVEGPGEVRAVTGEFTGPAPASCDVTVSDDTNSDVLRGAYTYQPLVPDATDLATDSVGTAPAAGGGAFRLLGDDLLDTSAVTFGGLVNDPKACDLQAQADGSMTGTVPAYRTPDGPFPAPVEVFAESAAGRDETPVAALFVYYGNPRLSGVAGPDGLAGTPCGNGCGRPGQLVNLFGSGFRPETWSHVDRVELREVGGGSGTSGEVGFILLGDTHLTFTLPGSARPNDVFDITIYTPNGSSACTEAHSFTIFRALSVTEQVCDDGNDEDGDGDFDCADSDCDARIGPNGEVCQPAGEETCYDGKDNDADGAADCIDEDCDGLVGLLGGADSGAARRCEFDTETRCADGFDNDGDGLSDCLSGVRDSDCDCGNVESTAVGNCSDGVDNDGDMLADGADPDCQDEGPLFPDSCTNGLDDDGDGLTDCLDTECFGTPNCETGNCADGIDNDGDGFADCADRDCAGDTGPAGESCQPLGEFSCADGEDNDGDGGTDCEDPNCDGRDGPGGARCETGTETLCADGFDNDGDGDVDCERGRRDDDCFCDDEESTELANCADGIDNDGDGLTDAADPNCGNEIAGLDNCADGIDNDGDGDIDCVGFPATGGDDGCRCEDESATNGNCADGIDNDDDGAVDCMSGMEDAGCDCDAGP